MSAPKQPQGGDTRFKKGKSSNPRGRPYGSQNMKTILKRELDRQVEVTIEGRSMRLSVREALCLRVANGFARGELDFIRLVLDFDLVDRREPMIIAFSELDALV